MDAEQYSKVKELFYAAQEVGPSQRAAFLAAQCNGDGELHDAVVELLESSAHVEGMFEKAAYEVLSETLNDVPDAIAGKRIGAYRILREINHGGMGAVYLAERDDNVYQKQVAIKILRGFYSADLRRRFYDERRILARLDHPNITKLLDGGTTDDDLPYYVMDYVEGVPLNTYCEQNELTINGRLVLFRKVCEAVQYAHRNLVIHRDLKPSNILVTADGTPQLLDFGIAKVFQEDENTEETRTNLRVMTPDYASPEQITGKIITTASDIYSLGIILHELLTGKRPFHFSGSLEEIIEAITKRDPPKPSLAIAESGLRNADSTDGSPQAQGKLDKHLEAFHNPQSAITNPQSLRGDLDTIVLKSLSKEPERRYATVEQFSEDIRRHLEGLPILARPDTFRYRSSKFIRRNKIGVAVAAGVFVLMVAGVIAILRQTRIAEHAAQVSTEQRNRALREQAKAERINKFFQQMLGFANPSWYAPGFNKGRDITVAQALDEAARKIENDLNEEPEVKAEILMTIGDTYASLSKFQPSEKVLESAVKLSRQVHGDNSIRLADALYFLANTKRGLNKQDEKMRLYEEAKAIYGRNSEKGNQFPYFLLDYANTFSLRGEHPQAIQLTKEAVDMIASLKGDSQNAVAVARMNLSTAYYLWGDMDNALAELLAAKGIMNPPTSTLFMALGRTYLAKGDFDQAEPFLLDAAKRYAEETELKWVSSALTTLATLYQERGEHRKAVDFMERALAIDRKLYPANDPSLIAHTVTHGSILVRAGKLKQGDQLMQRAFKQLSAEQQKGYEGLLGESLLVQKRFTEAEPLLRTYYQRLKDTQHPNSPRLKRALELFEAVTKSK